MNRFTPLRDLILGVLLLGVLFAFAAYIRQDVLSKLWMTVPQFYIAFWLLLMASHLLFAFGIARDASEQNAAGRNAFFVAPVVWGLATVVGGFFMVIVYWVFHHSTLRRD